MNIIYKTKVVYIAAVYLPSRKIYAQSQHYKHAIHPQDTPLQNMFAIAN